VAATAWAVACLIEGPGGCASQEEAHCNHWKFPHYSWCIMFNSLRKAWRLPESYGLAYADNSTIRVGDAALALANGTQPPHIEVGQSALPPLHSKHRAQL